MTYVISFDFRTLGGLRRLFESENGHRVYNNASDDSEDLV